MWQPERHSCSEKASMTYLVEGGSRLEGVLLRCEGVGGLSGRDIGQGWRMVHSQQRLQDTPTPLSPGRAHMSPVTCILSQQRGAMRSLGLH